jgi:hypothetical protein
MISLIVPSSATDTLSHAMVRLLARQRPAYGPQHADQPTAVAL